MDIGDTIQAKSDQLNADDLMAGPQVFTVAGVDVVGGDQPVHVHLTEAPGRPWKPSKGMRKALISVWGPRSADYAGRSIGLYRNPNVLWAGKPAGGIQVGAASHIDKPVTISVKIARGKIEPLTIKPLPAPAAPTATPTNQEN